VTAPPSGIAAGDLAGLYEDAPFGVVVFERSGEYRYLNRVALDLLAIVDDGLAPEELIGRRWREVYPHLADEEFGAAFEAVARGEPSRSVRAFRSARTGRVWAFHLWIAEDDRIHMIVEEATELLVGRELAFLAQRFPFGAVVTFDEDLRYLTAGGRGLAEAGIAATDLEGRTLYELWPEQVVERLEGPCREALEGREGRVLALYQDRYYECWTAPLPVAVDQAPRGVLMTWNVTERVRAEAQRQLIASAVDSLRSGLIIAEGSPESLSITYVNEGFTRLTGYTPADVLGVGFDVLRGPDTDLDAVAEMHHAMRENRPFLGVFRHYRKDGSEFWNRMEIAPVQGPGEESRHFIATQEDVTEQRRAGIQLKMHQRLSSVGRLAGGVAHDFRNVLTGVGGVLDFALEREDLPADLREDLEDARDVLRRSRSMTEHLLTFARRGGGPPAAVDLSLLLDERVDFLRRVFPAGMEIERTGDPAEAWITVEEGQLDQILLNLARNAQDAMPDGGTLTLALAIDEEALEPLPRPAELEEEEEGWVRLTVADDGVGMSQEIVERAVDPFFTTKSEGEGTGLGLATVYGIVTQSGGAMHIESLEGRGTSVHLLFPRVEPGEAAAHEAPSAPAVETKVTDILLVEDDRAVRRVCARALELAGHTVTTADDGGAGLDALERLGDHIDMVITDVMLPGVSGMSVARAAKKARPDRPVLIMSGYTEEEADPGTLPPPARYLSKPFQVDELTTVVRELLREATDG